jgi:hypothetical protein
MGGNDTVRMVQAIRVATPDPMSVPDTMNRSWPSAAMVRAREGRWGGTKT